MFGRASWPKRSRRIPSLSSSSDAGSIRRSSIAGSLWRGTGDVRRDRAAKPAAITPPHLALSPPQSRRPPDALGSSLAPLPPVISELVSRMRCPVRGSVLPSCLGLRRRRAHLGSIAESSRRPRTWSAEATLRPSARQPAGVPKCRTWPSLPTQRQAEGPNRVAFERGDCGEPSGSAGQRQSGAEPGTPRVRVGPESVDSFSLAF
jgi:hypothetical protein